MADLKVTPLSFRIGRLGRTRRSWFRCAEESLFGPNTSFFPFFLPVLTSILASFWFPMFYINPPLPLPVALALLVLRQSPPFPHHRHPPALLPEHNKMNGPPPSSTPSLIYGYSDPQVSSSTRRPMLTMMRYRCTPSKVPHKFSSMTPQAPQGQAPAGPFGLGRFLAEPPKDGNVFARILFSPPPPPGGAPPAQNRP